MGNILLVLVVLFLAGMAFAGYKKGFIKIILTMAALIVTIALSAILTPTITTILKDKTPLYDTIYVKMESFVSGETQGQVVDQTDQQATALESLALPESIKNALIDKNTGDSYIAMGVDSFAAYTAKSLTLILLNAISFIILFIIISIVFGVIMQLANIFTKIPLIKGANKMAGIAAGLLEGILILWILAMIVTACGATTWGQSALRMIDDSVFLSFLYNNNLLTKLITSIF